jgi:uncharacterized protein (TIGR00725 family)
VTAAVPWIAVCGPGEEATEEECLAAEETGAAVAAAGAILVCGGLGGVMEAACRGAKSMRGHTVGLLPRSDREEANGWVDFAIPTGLGELRNGLIVRAADAIVAIGGGYGTLSEIALALKAGKPVVGVGTWELPAAGGPAQPAAEGPAMPGVVAAGSPGAAVETALRLLSQPRG